jgi:hypothetical protein
MFRAYVHMEQLGMNDSSSLDMYVNVNVPYQGHHPLFRVVGRRHNASQVQSDLMS